MFILIPVLVIVALVVLLAVVLSDKYVPIVKNGYLEEYSDEITDGDAFEGFFANGVWTEFKTEKGDIIVEFNGECEYGDDMVDVCVQFEVDEDEESFEVICAERDDELLSRSERVYLFKTVYEKKMQTNDTVKTQKTGFYRACIGKLPLQACLCLF